MFSADLGVTPSASTLYADEVFSTLLYTGNGSSLTVNNGIDLAGKGGMVWVKNRTQSPGRDHYVFDSVRGANYTLYPNQTYAQVLQGSGTTLSSTGFTTTYGDADFNASGQSYVSWTFREAPKFFDVVTYTGDGTGTSRLLTHNLGITPGLYFIKSTLATGDWLVGAPGLGTNRWANLNTTFNWGNNTSFWLASSATTFGPGNTGGSNILNVNGQTYVAYLFADDPSTTGLIRCGSFTTDANGNASVTSLGWEPQFLMVKASSTTGDWIMLDTMRGWNMTSADALLRANLSNAETASTEYGNPTATGFDFKGGAASATYVYMTIRRANAPTSPAASIFAPAVYTGTGATQAIVNGINLSTHGGMVWQKKRTLVSGNLNNHVIFDTARGLNIALFPDLQDIETNPGNDTFVSWNNSGFTMGTGSSRLNQSGETYISWAFRKAAGFFDIVTYTGGGSTIAVSHNLGATPQMIIFKARNNANHVWAVYHASLGVSIHIPLNFDTGSTNIPILEAAPTASNFTLKAYENRVNAVSVNYVAYLFGSLAGISKVGSYTGNGSTQAIDCGFAAGARFLLIKRSNAQVFGDNASRNWYIWDTARGITPGNDPFLIANSNAVESTNDSITPNAVGFTVIQNAVTNINISGANYIYLAIA